MERLLSYTKISDFLENLAKKHVDVKDYVEDSAIAIQEKLSSVDGLKSPFVSFTSYEGKLSGNQQRTFNERKISFVVCFTGISVDDLKQQKEAKTNAEEIGLDFLGRINIDSKTTEIGWLYNNFIKETVEYNDVELEFIEGVFGMEFSFELKTTEPLVVNPSKWIDGDKYCKPTY